MFNQMEKYFPNITNSSFSFTEVLCLLKFKHLRSPIFKKMLSKINLHKRDL